MREILFRGKIPGIIDWVYGYYAKSGDDYFILLDTDSEDNWSIVASETVGQYTGKTDMHRVKIFEGDKVRYDDDETGYIEWDEETARFIISGDGVIYDFDNFRGDELEVIGNIHDNPELLQEE